MERERGRKSYFVHTMRQDVAILCSKYKTIATKPVSGPLWRQKDNHNKDTGAMPLMISTREKKWALEYASTSYC